MNYSNAQTMDLHRQPTSHGVCFNLGHYNAGRIEIRLVGGQKNFACFRNTMEVIFHLVERVKKLSWKQCNDIQAIFKGCNNYVVNRLKSHAMDRGLISVHDFVEIEHSAQTADFTLE